MLMQILDFLNSTGGMVLLALLLFVILDGRDLTKREP
jgi:hypothetical protein